MRPMSREQVNLTTIARYNDHDMFKTKDHLLLRIADGFSYDPKMFAEEFVLEEYPPIVDYSNVGLGLDLVATSTEIIFTQQYKIRLKTEEEKEVERSIRAQKMASDAGLPSSTGPTG